MHNTGRALRCKLPGEGLGGLSSEEKGAAVALVTDFDAPEIVSEVYAPPLPTDGDCEFADHPSIIDMIEEERCHRSPDGTHTYMHKGNHCVYCGMQAPWVRRDMCRQL